MRIHSGHAILLGRAVLGGYLAAHGAQKLFGSFDGPGLDATTGGFEYLGLTPSRQMATLAGAAELGGGVLTATGIAHPLGPVAIAGTMAVASTTHRDNGALGANGGYELPLTNLAFAAVLAATGPGALRLGPRLPRKLTVATTVGAVALAAASVAKLLTHTPPPAEDDQADDPSPDTEAPAQQAS